MYKRSESVRIKRIVSYRHTGENASSYFTPNFCEHPLAIIRALWRLTAPTTFLLTVETHSQPITCWPLGKFVSVHVLFATSASYSASMATCQYERCLLLHTSHTPCGVSVSHRVPRWKMEMKYPSLTKTDKHLFRGVDSSTIAWVRRLATYLPDPCVGMASFARSNLAGLTKRSNHIGWVEITPQ